MLIVCNGIYKSGSTWVYMISKELIETSPLRDGWAEHYNEKNIKLTSSFLSESNTVDDNYAVKSHCYNRQFLELLMKDYSSIVLYSDRDDFELIQSHYHHFSYEKLKLPFFIYLMTFGFFKMVENQVFKAVVELDSLYSLKVNFRELKENPVKVVMDISDALGVVTTEELARLIVEKTNMKNRRNDKTKTGMSDRDWFFDRKEEQASRVSKNLFSLLNAASKALSCSDLLVSLMASLFQKIKNRSEYSRFINSR